MRSDDSLDLVIGLMVFFIGLYGYIDIRIAQSRFEIIDHTKDGQGRVFVKYGNNLKVETSMQDANRTLKVFISDTKAPIPVSRAEINKMYALTLLKQCQPDEPELDGIVNQLAKYIKENA